MTMNDGTASLPHGRRGGGWPAGDMRQTGTDGARAFGDVDGCSIRQPTYCSSVSERCDFIGYVTSRRIIVVVAEGRRVIGRSGSAT